MRGKKQLLGGKSNSAPQLLKNWHAVPSGGRKEAFYTPLTAALHLLHNNRLMTKTQSISISKLFPLHQPWKGENGCVQHQSGYGLFGYFVKRRSYLSIVLKHLIALHVVTLEHDDGSVEAGDVQTEVICPDFFVRSVWEHLETQCLTQKGRQLSSLSFKICITLIVFERKGCLYKPIDFILISRYFLHDLCCVLS